jgi:hypothetical protein
MSRTVKLGLYLVLLVAAGLLGVKFLHVYHAVMHAPLHEAVESGEPAPAPPVKTVPASTNLAATTNAPTEVRVPASTNLAGSTNAPIATNKPAVTNQASSTNLAGARTPPASDTPPPPPAPASVPSYSTLFGYGAALFFVVVLLGLLLAHDFSHFVADRFYNFILSEDGEGFKAPEYERAEQVWTDGRPLEAIQMMRDYFKEHPRELYVSLRIAEIYEKDLGNYLAAALEYEEVLKHRLRPEQWGWAAIHLANLYSGKLDQTDKAVALLRRIDSEYGQTAAAAKARTRLSQLEGEDKQAAPIRVEIEEEPAPPSVLPKGFRPKEK